jgi:ubiquinone/menaquinone biosynthesis C-methylase UbiE
MPQITPREIKEMSYIDLMAFLQEVNRPPGGKDSIRIVAQNCLVTKDSKILDIGCNTGYCSFEIVHLAKCSVTGVDISPEMIKTAKKFQKEDSFGSLIKFKVANAMNLPFKDGVFDVVVSGGSTAFIDNKEKAIKEYKRVLKSWGFIADINFYYREKPPMDLILHLNVLMDTKIEPWDMNYWLELYDRCDLERYFVYTKNISPASDQEIEKYCTEMTKNKNLSEEAKNILQKRLVNIMKLFNENHKYLSYGVFILRKRLTKEQVSLFGA